MNPAKIAVLSLLAGLALGCLWSWAPALTGDRVSVDLSDLRNRSCWFEVYKLDGQTIKEQVCKN